MPLPLLLVGAAVATGITGLVKGGQAIGKNWEADDINDDAEGIIENASASLDEIRQKTAKKLEALGRLRLRVWDREMVHFVASFEKLKHVDLRDGAAQDYSKKLVSKEVVAEIARESLEVSNLLTGGVGALGSGALIAYGSYGGVMAFGAASTGTAISGLTGVAATNATLAWLGGGSLAAGGYGMAGGMAVLGGLVAGPALLVGGFVLSSAAEKRLSEARANKAKAKVAAEKMKEAEAALKAINKMANLFVRQIRAYRKTFGETMERFDELLATKGENYAEFVDEERKVVRLAVEQARIMKYMLDLPLLNEEGRLHAGADGIRAPQEALVEKLS